jgi:hypothetical protein
MLIAELAWGVLRLCSRRVVGPSSSGCSHEHEGGGPPWRVGGPHLARTSEPLPCRARQGGRCDPRRYGSGAPASHHDSVDLLNIWRARLVDHPQTGSAHDSRGHSGEVAPEPAPEEAHKGSAGGSEHGGAEGNGQTAEEGGGAEEPKGGEHSGKRHNVFTQGPFLDSFKVGSQRSGKHVQEVVPRRC